MNTKNIFRTLFLSIALMMGVGSIFADEYEVTTIWGPSSQTLNWEDWGNGHVEYSIKEASVGDIIRIKGTMGSLGNWFNVQLTEMNVPNWNNSNTTGQWTSAEEGYVDAVISSDMLDKLKGNQVLNLTGYNFIVTEMLLLHNSDVTDDGDGDNSGASGDNGSSEDGQVLWEGRLDGSAGYQIWIGAEEFAEATATSIIRIYVENGNRILIVSDNSTWTDLWQNSHMYEGGSYYNAAGQYYEFTAGECLSLLQTKGLYIECQGATITKVTLTSDDDSQAIKHTLTIDIDGQITSKSVAEGADLESVLPANPTKTGHTFAGWENMPEDGKMPANDLTITALFTINSYTLTYMIDGEQYDSETYEYGATITPRGEPTKDGYTFSGWNGLPTTMPDHDVTVTGSYTKNREYVSASVGSHGYATFSSTRPLDFSGVSGVKAYIAQSVSDNTVELVQVTGTCAAETGLVLIGDNNNYQIPVASTDGESYSSSQNLLVAVLSSTEIKSSSDFVLTYQDGRVAFAATGGQAAVIPAGHAYLHWAQSRGARALKVVVAGETTGINAVENALTGNEVIYNLRGQRVVNPGKGVYIINGKKVVLK